MSQYDSGEKFHKPWNSTGKIKLLLLLFQQHTGSFVVLIIKVLIGRIFWSACLYICLFNFSVSVILLRLQCLAFGMHGLHKSSPFS